MAEKMLRNVSELMLASVSHYEILEGERFGPKFAQIRTAVCLFFFGGGGADWKTWFCPVPSFTIAIRSVYFEAQKHSS